MASAVDQIRLAVRSAGRPVRLNGLMRLNASTAAGFSPVSPFSPGSQGRAELERLVRLIAERYPCPPDELDEMLRCAAGDPEAAIESFRAMARELSHAWIGSSDATVWRLQADALPDPAAETRRQQVLAMLRVRPAIRYAMTTDLKSDPDAVILTLGHQGEATCELRIPPANYEAFALVDLINKHAGGA